MIMSIWLSCIGSITRKEGKRIYLEFLLMTRQAAIWMLSTSHKLRQQAILKRVALFLGISL